MANTTPRSAISKNARVALPKVNVTRNMNSGKRAPATPKLKLIGDLKKLPTNPRPKVPDLFKPIGGGTGEENPQVTPRNSPKGVKQRIGIKNPMSAL